MLLNRLQLNHFDRKEELIIKSVHVNFLNVWPCMLIVTLFHSIIKVQKPSDAKESLTLLASVRWGEPICTTENIRISAQVVFFPSYSVCSMMSDIVTGRTSPSGSHYLQLVCVFWKLTFNVKQRKLIKTSCKTFTQFIFYTVSIRLPFT